MDRTNYTLVSPREYTNIILILSIKFTMGKQHDFSRNPVTCLYLSNSSGSSRMWHMVNYLSEVQWHVEYYEIKTFVDMKTTYVDLFLRY